MLEIFQAISKTIKEFQTKNLFGNKFGEISLEIPVPISGAFEVIWDDDIVSKEIPGGLISCLLRVMYWKYIEDKKHEYYIYLILDLYYFIVDCCTLFLSMILTASPLLIVYLPLSSGLAILIFSRFLGKKGALFLNLLSLFVSFILVLFFLFGTDYKKNLVFFNYNSSKFSMMTKTWADSLQNWDIHFDFISLSMCFLVVIVSLLVNFYAYNYLLLDPHLSRFFSYLSFFTFFMLFLVCSNNLIQFFFAWEGVGICSYLLIGFWSTRIQAVKSAMKAVLLNKVGDLALLFSIAYSWNLLNACSFTELKHVVQKTTIHSSFGLSQSLDAFLMNKALILITVFFIVAAVAKSAQIGLHTWLPDAMEGPTPVSALIHAATMVTAGILLILRVSPILMDQVTIMYIMLLMGALTALMSGFIACFQTDLKKIIAYSTCSQLGYMFFACGASLYSISLLHLIGHGFFKALLFLVAGSFIHLMNNEQAANKIFLFENVKLTSLYTISLYIGLTSLTALPFFSGFYTKEAILLMSLNNFWGGSWLAGSLGYILGIVAALLTAIYSAAMLEDIMYTNPKKLRSNSLHNFIPLSTITALCVLGTFSIFFGFYFSNNWVQVYNNIFSNDYCLGFTVQKTEWLAVNISITGDLFTIPLSLELLPLWAGILLTAIPRSTLSTFLEKHLFTFKYHAKNPQKHFKIYKNFGLLKNIAQNKFWFDYVINLMARNILSFSYSTLFKKTDKGLLETFGPTQSITLTWTTNFFTRFFGYNVILEGLILLFIVISFYFIFFL